VGIGYAIVADPLFIYSEIIAYWRNIGVLPEGLDFTDGGENLIVFDFLMHSLDIYFHRQFINLANYLGTLSKSRNSPFEV